MVDSVVKRMLLFDKHYQRAGCAWSAIKRIEERTDYKSKDSEGACHSSAGSNMCWNISHTSARGASHMKTP